MICATLQSFKSLVNYNYANCCQSLLVPSQSLEMFLKEGSGVKYHLKVVLSCQQAQDE